MDDELIQLCGLAVRDACQRMAPQHLLLRGVPGLLYDLMSAVGPAADDIIAASRRRLVARLRAGDAGGAAREMEQHLGGLVWLRRLSQDGAAQDGAAPDGAARDIAV